MSSATGEQTRSASAPAANRPVAIWLALVCLLIALMVLLGGATRLTQSGLSMVHWRPVTGVLPPLSEADWQAAFRAYQQYPEYQLVNPDMSLAGFKAIFWWEYTHRLLGRVIGIAFFVPFMVFLALGRIARAYRPRLWLALALGGLQGLLGWHMVQSGLIDVPRVSHYRLAAHLLLALFILVYLYWLLLDLRGASQQRASPWLARGAFAAALPWQLRGAAKQPASPWLARGAWLFAAALALQLLLGAFTAGLDAGKGFNTYPLMDGRLLPPAATMMQPWPLNLVENGVMTQFLHRWLGAALALLALALAAAAWRTGGAPARLAAFVAALTLAQFALGIATLVYAAPLPLASLHQALAVLLALATTHLLHTLSAAAQRHYSPQRGGVRQHRCLRRCAPAAGAALAGGGATTTRSTRAPK